MSTNHPPVGGFMMVGIGIRNIPAWDSTFPGVFELGTINLTRLDDSAGFIQKIPETRYSLFDHGAIHEKMMRPCGNLAILTVFQ